MEDEYILKDGTLYHAGVKGMKWGKHLPGTDWWKESTGNFGSNALSKTQFSSLRKKQVSTVPRIKGTYAPGAGGVGTRVEAKPTTGRQRVSKSNGNSDLGGKVGSHDKQYDTWERQAGRKWDGYHVSSDGTGVVSKLTRDNSKRSTYGYKINAAFEKGKKKIGKAWETGKEKVSSAYSTARSATSKLWNKGKNYTQDQIKKFTDQARKAYDSHKDAVLRYFANSDRSEHKTVGGNTRLDEFVNKQLNEACEAWTKAAAGGNSGSYINSFIQSVQFNVASGVNNYLKSIGMDDNVDRFMSKIFGDTKRDLQNKSKSK